MSKALSRPSGTLPPGDATLPDGTRVELQPLAERITDLYAEAFPDEDERYSPEWRAWCIHDNQHILRWAIDAEQGLVDLGAQVSWLAGILQARDFPLDRLVRNLQLAADVLGERIGPPAQAAARGLRTAAEQVANQPRS